jgi:hypothetical protein
MSIQVALVYNKANPFGIKQDADILESMLREYNKSVGLQFAKVKHADLLEPPFPCDVCIHLEIPATTWMPFAHKNVMMVNSEWWVPAWDCLLPKFDLVLGKIKDAAADLSGVYVPWRPSLDDSSFKGYTVDTREASGCVWFLGGSKNKRAFAEILIPLWKAEYPPLTVYTTSPLTVVSCPENVKIIVKDLNDEIRKQLQHYYPIHVVASCSEGFGLAAAEGEVAGAFLIANNIPAYTCAFDGNTNVGWLHTPLRDDAKYTRAKFADLSGADLAINLQANLDQIFEKLKTADFVDIYDDQRQRSRVRANNFREAMIPLLKNLVTQVDEARRKVKGNRHLPPALDPNQCPPISVVTLTFNRRQFIDLAFHNIILTDYPKDKIEWVIVDDSNDPEQSISDKVAQFAKRAPVAQVVYVPLPRKHSIGYKRNLGVERASNEIILFMDDDDHYPDTSFRRRVAWLTKHPWQPKVVACSTIACYDLVKGVSAVNTPPWELGPAERVSEATMTFYKSFWQERKFPQVNIAEGEEFLKGREQDLMDIPPQQILVAFSHQGNSSGRRIPSSEENKPGCFWGFPKEYLIWIHKLAGIEVEEEKEVQNKVKTR